MSPIMGGVEKYVLSALNWICRLASQWPTPSSKGIINCFPVNRSLFSQQSPPGKRCNPTPTPTPLLPTLISDEADRSPVLLVQAKNISFVSCDTITYSFKMRGGNKITLAGGEMIEAVAGRCGTAALPFTAGHHSSEGIARVSRA